jgi:hypothetical protein
MLKLHCLDLTIDLLALQTKLKTYIEKINDLQNKPFVDDDEIIQEFNDIEGEGESVAIKASHSVTNGHSANSSKTINLNYKPVFLKVRSNIMKYCRFLKLPVSPTLNYLSATLTKKKILVVHMKRVVVDPWGNIRKFDRPVDYYDKLHLGKWVEQQLKSKLVFSFRL